MGVGYNWYRILPVTCDVSIFVSSNNIENLEKKFGERGRVLVGIGIYLGEGKKLLGFKVVAGV